MKEKINLFKYGNLVHVLPEQYEELSYDVAAITDLLAEAIEVIKDNIDEIQNPDEFEYAQKVINEYDYGS